MGQYVNSPGQCLCIPSMLGDFNPSKDVHNRGMHTRLISVLVAFLGTSLASVALAVRGLDLPSNSLVVVGLVLVTTVACIGLTVNHGRWASRTLIITTLVSTLLVLLSAPSPLWYAAVGGVGVSVVILVSGALEPLIRQLPPPAPLPRPTLLLLLSLIGTPLLLGLIGGESPAHITFAGLAIFLAWRLGQGGPVGLWLSRLVLPLAGIWATAATPSPERYLVLAAVMSMTGAAWTKATGLVTVPLVTHAQLKPVFAELAPADILAAAGYDERGKKLEKP